MKYLKARELIEAILNEVLVDDPVTPGQGKAPSLLPKPTRPTNPKPPVNPKPTDLGPGLQRIRNPFVMTPRNRDVQLIPRSTSEAILDEGDPNRGDGNMKKYGGTRANKLVSPGMKSYGVVNPKTGKPVKTLGKLHKRLEKLSPEDLKRYRNQYGIRTGSGRLFPQP
jgi:hypothetical protein